MIQITRETHDTPTIVAQRRRRQPFRAHPLYHVMRKGFILAAVLLLCCAISARPKTEQLTFVFLRVDRAHGVAYLRPMIAPDLGVQLNPGAETLKPGTVLRCSAVTREHPATVDGQPAHLTELLLDCLPAGKAGGDHQLVVKGLDFSPHR